MIGLNESLCACWAVLMDRLVVIKLIVMWGRNLSERISIYLSILSRVSGIIPCPFHFHFRRCKTSNNAAWDGKGKENLVITKEKWSSFHSRWMDGHSWQGGRETQLPEFDKKSFCHNCFQVDERKRNPLLYLFSLSKWTIKCEAILVYYFCILSI